MEDGIVIVVGNKMKLYDLETVLVASGVKSKIYKIDPSNDSNFVLGSVYIEKNQGLNKE